MLQSPLIMIKRGSIEERSELKHLDQNRQAAGNARVYRNKYNKRNRYEDQLFPMPINQPEQSQEFLLVDIPRYVTVSYDLMMWCAARSGSRVRVGLWPTHHRSSPRMDGRVHLAIIAPRGNRNARFARNRNHRWIHPRCSRSTASPFIPPNQRSTQLETCKR